MRIKALLLGLGVDSGPSGYQKKLELLCRAAGVLLITSLINPLLLQWLHGDSKAVLCRKFRGLQSHLE